MHKERKIPDLKEESLKKHPFTVPDGYFESFAGRVQERINEEELSGAKEQTIAAEQARHGKGKSVPVRRLLSSARYRVAMAAAIVGLALISYTVIRTVLNGENLNDSADIALLEQLNIIDDDVYLMSFIEENMEVPSEEEAYVNQAIEYLAMADVEMDLIFE